MKHPKPKKIPKTLKSHGDIRKDPYYWMNQRDHKDVLAHLKKEAQYFDAVTQLFKKQQKNLFQEIKKRIPGKDSSAPYRMKNHLYWIQYKEGQEYPIFCRRKYHHKESKQPKEILLDVNQLAKGHSYYDVSGTALSFSKNILAFSVDCVGRRFYTIYFKDLKSGRILSHSIPNTTGGVVWANDNQTLFYTKQDQQTLRAYQVFRYDLKSQKSELVFEELDVAFSVGVYKTLSTKHIFIQSSSTLTTECRFVLANEPKKAFQLFHKRKKGHRYFVDDGKTCFYILTNSNDCKNYRLDKASMNQYQLKHWKPFIPYDPSIYIEDFEVFSDWIAIEIRKNGVTEILLMDRKKKKVSVLPVKGECRSVSLGINAEYKTNVIRFHYESMNQPEVIYDYSISKKEKKLIKRKKLAIKFFPKQYVSERKMAIARDGSQVPISILYKKDQFQKAKNPLYLYGYGAYGLSMDPFFSTSIYSLVDRGFVFAIAHIRGGAEMGKHWYESGKLLKKKNTFYDFIDCSDYLIQEGYVHPKKLYAGGGSAGGLLMGSVLNLRPELYKGIVAHVPFVDALTTMQDKTIPLTTQEYDEWGNPNQKSFYRYIQSYSPYDNIQKNQFPELLVTAGYHDSQVQYWEPMKWVAKLRDHQKGKSKILLYMDQDSGHSGVTGRFKRLKLLAMEYAFLLHHENLI